MKLFLFALGLCLCSYTFGVYVQVGDRSFPLEAVKALKDLIDMEDFDINPHVAETSVVSVCKDPLLPQVFRPVCQGKGAAMTLSRLTLQRLVPRESLYKWCDEEDRIRYERINCSKYLVFTEKIMLISPIDPCEICANPSCFGCLS